MGQHTDIEYADSSVNEEIGCDGCELFNKRADIFSCYAGNLVERFGGANQMPGDFSTPQVYPGRIAASAKWKDLTGTTRAPNVNKPWLDGLPRIIFVNDMGDGFTASLDLQYLHDALPALRQAPHIYLFLTKRADRMLEFARACAAGAPLPQNLWWGVSVTMPETRVRLNALRHIKLLGGRTWVSYEPALGAVDLEPALDWMDWLTLGGESNQPRHKARPMDFDGVRAAMKLCERAGVPVFVKQMGSVWASERGSLNRKGGNWNEWDSEFRVRQMPRALMLQHSSANGGQQQRLGDW